MTTESNPADAVREALSDPVRKAIRVFDQSAARTYPNKQTEAWEVLRAHIAALTARADNAEAQIRDAWRELSCSDDISALLIAEGINQLQRAREQAEVRLAALAGAAPGDMSDEAIGRVADQVYADLRENGYTGAQGGMWWNKCMFAAGYRAATDTALATPAGSAVVPRVPTQAMVDAFSDPDVPGDDAWVRECWAAMLNAAPHAPAKAREDDRVDYWKQRAKSAEGHLFASDLSEAAKALHKVAALRETPWDELTDVQRWGLEHAALQVIATVNAQRDTRAPKDAALATFAEGE